MMNARTFIILLSAIALSGCCATKEYVDQQDTMLGDRIGKLESRVSNAESRLTTVEGVAADASKKADQAQACCDANTQKIEKAFELLQKK